MSPETDASPQRSGPIRRALNGVGAVWHGLRQVFFGVLPAAGIIVLVFMLMREVRKEDIEIAPISVPKHLADQGLTPETVAVRLLDALDASSRAVLADAVDRPAAELAGSQPDFNVPIAGLSLRATANLLRGVLGYPQRRITGEMVLEQDDRLGIRLRMQGFGQIADLRGFPVAAPDAVLAAAAPEIWRVIQPRMYVWHLFRQGGSQALLRQRLDELVGQGRLDAETLRTVDYVRARSLIASGRAEGALRIAEGLTAADPGWPLGWHAMGLALRAQNRADAALEAFRQGMLTARHTTWPHQAMAGLLRDRSQYQQALDVLSEARRIRPDDAEVWIQEAYTLAAMGRGPDAVEAAERAVTMATYPGLAYAALARALNAASRHQAAIEAADAAIRVSPNSGNAYVQKGDALSSLNDTDGALATFEQGRRVDPSEPFVHSGAGWANRRLSRHDAALAAFDRAIALRSANGQFHAGRGLSLVALGRDDDARAALLRATELGYRTTAVVNAMAQLNMSPAAPSR